ncbi:MAG: helix-turn-helix domain-containing protein [Candidatus Methylacidiphilales bacterium]
MDFLIKHWALEPRSFPSRLQIQTIGYLQHKTGWIRTSFNTLNFSFILSGGGRLNYHGKSHAVIAPCLMWQRPGIYMEYGPELPHDHWSELYVVYAARTEVDFIENKMVRPDQPVTTVHRGLRLEELLLDLSRRVSGLDPESAADWLDRAMEMLLFQALSVRNPLAEESKESPIVSLREQLGERMNQAVDWDKLARKQGMSTATFRRHWKSTLGSPPGRELQSMKLREAQRLLVHTSLRIGEIAQHIGFADPLYFSRWFHRRAGLTAKAYRKAYQLRSEQ